MKPGWKTAKFKDVSTVVGGSTPKTDIPEYWGGDNYWVAPAELDGSKFISSTVKRITNLAASKTNLSLLPKGTVLLSSRAPIGKVAITTVPMYCNQGFKNIVCGPELFNGYVYYFLKHNVDYLQSLGTGATFKEISKKVVENVSISYPSLDEQQRIVDELDLLTGIIDKKKAQLRDLDALAQSIFYEMFGDPIANEKGWRFCALKDVADIVGGSTPKTNVVEYWGGTYNWVTPAELYGERYQGSTERKISDLAVEKTNLTLLPVGTVLLSSRAPIGKVAITTEPMYCNQGFKNLICSESLNNEYVYQALKCKTEYLQSLGTGATFKEISKKTTENIKIAVPPIALQTEFAEKVVAIETQKRIVSESLIDSQALFDSKMSYYFE